MAKYIISWIKETNLTMFLLYIFLNICEKYNNYFDKNKMTSLSKSSLKTKELFDTIFSKICSEGGDFPHIIEI